VNTVRGRAFAWLTHPVTVAALALLIINDHVLKAAFPGWVTGKLSDVAGMVVAPPLLAALAGLIAPRVGFRRLAAGAIVAVGVGFTIIKIWSYGSELASEAWSLITPSLVRADAADLVALPFLAVAWWVAHRPLADPLSRRWLRALRLAVVLPVALFGVAATSSGNPPKRVPQASIVTVGADGDVYLKFSDGWHPLWSVSRDGGLTWAPAKEPAGAEPVPCSRVAPLVCYRVVPGELGVQSDTGDARWPYSWRIPDQERAKLKHAHGVTDLTSLSLSVLDVEGGHVVVVANGPDGFAVRDRYGVWARIGFPGVAAPIDVSSVVLPEEPPAAVPGSQPDLALAFLFGGLILTVVPVWRLWRSGGGAQWWWLVAPLLAAAALTMTLDSTVAAGVTSATALICSVIALVGARVGLPSVLGAFLLLMGALGVSWGLWLALGDAHVAGLVLFMTIGSAAVTPAVAKLI
jgi:hypothetical protein